MNVIGGQFDPMGRALAGELLEGPSPILQALPIAAYACDAQGRLSWFNRRAAELWGRTPQINDDTELFCGSHCLFGLDGTSIPRESTPMAHVLRTGEPVQGREAVVMRPDGSRVIATLTIEPVEDEDGRLRGAVCCVHETSDSRRLNKEPTRSEIEFRQLLDALPAAVYTTDAHGKLTFYNRAAAELAGREPAIGSDYWCVTHRIFQPDGAYLPHENCPMAVALRENRPIRGVEIVAERPDGDRVPCLPFPTPIRDAEGNLLGGINMIVDIRERKEAEARHQALLTELNHRVKNNMQMLDALLRSAQRRTHNPEAQSVLADAGRRVAAMSAAQQVLYDTSDSLVFDAGKFLESVSAPVRRQHGRQTAVTLETELQNLPNDVAMPLALILNELLANAVTHGLNGRKHGKAAVRLTQEPGEYVLSVEDDGPGFGLAEPHEQAAGLGLVQGLVRQLGGRFEVTGPGARCTVRFADPHRVH